MAFDAGIRPLTYQYGYRQPESPHLSRCYRSSHLVRVRLLVGSSVYPTPIARSIWHSPDFKHLRILSEKCCVVTTRYSMLSGPDSDDAAIVILIM